MNHVLLSRLDILLPFFLALPWLVAGIIGIIWLTSLNTTQNRRLLNYAVLVLSLGVFLELSTLFYKFTIDDAYISLRFARNLASGYGLLFSTDGSPPVEGYTNFLWTVMQTPLFILKLPDNIILHSIKLVGIVFGIGIIVVTYSLIRLVTSDDAVGLLGALLLAAIPQLSFWAIGGLETTMYIFWLLMGIYIYLVEQRNGKAHIWSMIFFALMALTRPEGLFLVVAILLWELATCFLKRNKLEISRRIRYLIPGATVFALIYGVYFLWRYSYYGFLLPNTFYARSGTLGILQILRRLYEMAPFVACLLPLAAFAWFGYFRSKIRNQEKEILSVVLLVLIAFSFASKREWMPGFRYELPFVPILILFSSVGIHQMLLNNAEGPTCQWRSYVTKLGVLLCLGMFLLYPAVKLQRSTHYTDELNRAHVTLGKWLRKYAPKDASYASWDMGAVPYYSELPLIFDIAPEGILSTYTTHKGYDVDNFLSCNPSFIVLPPESNLSRKDGMRAFYRNSEFRENYQLLFSFAMRENYILTVYKHRAVHIAQPAIDEGCVLAERSFTDAYSDSSR